MSTSEEVSEASIPGSKTIGYLAGHGIDTIGIKHAHDDVYRVVWFDGCAKDTWINRSGHLICQAYVQYQFQSSRYRLCFDTYAHRFSIQLAIRLQFE
jgi:hypothetical protein